MKLASSSSARRLLCLPTLKIRGQSSGQFIIKGIVEWVVPHCQPYRVKQGVVLIAILALFLRVSLRLFGEPKLLQCEPSRTGHHDARRFTIAPADYMTRSANWLPDIG